jgi:hypothetical protein
MHCGRKLLKDHHQRIGVPIEPFLGAWRCAMANFLSKVLEGEQKATAGNDPNLGKRNASRIGYSDDRIVLMLTKEAPVHLPFESEATIELFEEALALRFGYEFSEAHPLGAAVDESFKNELTAVCNSSSMTSGAISLKNQSTSTRSIIVSRASRCGATGH